jgi:hypothetical protein
LLGSDADAAHRCSSDVEATTMAKGQKRSNKEVKKPKQVKPKASPSPSLSSRPGEMQERGKSPKK